MCRLTIRKLRLFSLGFLSFIIGTHPEWLADCFRIIGVCGILCSLIVTIGPWVPVGFCRDAVYTVLVISVTCIGLSVAYHDTIVRLGFPFEYATGISGTVLQDARIGSDGRCVVEIKLHRCISVFGSESTASGKTLIFCPAHMRETLPAGIAIDATGSWRQTDDERWLFSAKSVRVTSNDHVQVRPFLLDMISKHMRQLQDDASAMGNLLLLGIGDGTSEQRIKQLAVESGCAHVLALSGMHLNVLSSLIASALGLLIGSRRAKLVTLIPSASYVWLVGYKPSLLRALCMQSYVAIRNDNDCADQALWFACIVQVYLTPYDMFSTGCLLSYSALAGILLYTEPIEALLRFVMPHCMAKALSVSLAALIFSAPIVLNVFGLWYPIGIIVGCLVAPLACLMLCLLFAWCLVPAPLLYKIIHVLTNIFLGIIDKASAWSNAHPSYSNYASLATVGSVLLTAALILRYACACVRKRSMNIDGMGLPLRIGKSNRRIA